MMLHTIETADRMACHMQFNFTSLLMDATQAATYEVGPPIALLELGFPASYLG